MKTSGQDTFLPLFVLQLPQKTLARYEVDQSDWADLLAVLLDVDVSKTNLTDSLISLDDFCAMFRVALERFGRDSFLRSYVGDIRARHMGAVGLAMEAAPTIDDTLDIWRDNATILAPMLHVEERETAEDRIYSVSYSADIGDIGDAFMELILLMTAALVRNLSSGAVTAGIQLAQPASHPPEYYRDNFGLHPVFGQTENLLVFSRRESARGNDYYAPLLYQQALKGIRDLQENIRSHVKLGFRVRKYLQQQSEAGCYPSLEEVAEHFCMAPRTFTRHLGEEDLSFRALRNDIQLSLAKRLLRRSRLPVKAIAEKVGFGNVSAFSRAFHLACGQTPAEFRGGDEGSTPGA